jgi:hypothetical protein
MGRPAVLLLAAALLPLLAGCSGRPSAEAFPPSALETGAAGLLAGHYYGFRHGGGDLVFAVPANGSAEAVLYGADDARVGHVGLGAGRASGRFVIDGLDAGELVLDVLSINGTLDVRSGGDPVRAFRDLPLHVERHVLASRPARFPPLPTPFGGRLDASLNVTLLRAPAALRVVERAASYQDLTVSVTGRDGVVHSVDTTGNQPPFPAYDGVVPGETYPENIRDGALAATVHASQFEGTLLLEAESFSRAAVDDGGAHASRDVPRFTYGRLPDGPVSFEVRDGARQLYLWIEANGTSQTASTSPSPSQSQRACDAHSLASSCRDLRPAVALFGPHDERVATVILPAGQTFAVPVHQAGKWVAVLLRGEATLGADAVPGDFELHPLDTAEAATPAQAAGGSDGSYGEQREALAVAGVPYHVDVVQQYPGSNTPFGLPDFGVADCGSSLAVLSGGETIAAWGYTGVTAPSWDPDLYLGGALEAVHADSGGACGRLAAVVTGYQR